MPTAMEAVVHLALLIVPMSLREVGHSVPYKGGSSITLRARFHYSRF
jgi:hypothetical protein